MTVIPRLLSTNIAIRKLVEIDQEAKDKDDVDEPTVLKGVVDIFGATFHVFFVKVQDVDGEQVTVNDPYGRLEDVHQLDQDLGSFETVTLQGIEGEWVMYLHPFER